MNTTKEKEEGIPIQRRGNQLDTEHSVVAASLSEAQKIFAMAVDRMLDVNCWDKLCGPLSATFRLTDDRGHEIDRPARPGDHFKIDIPAPGPASGKGYDWVRVEALEDKRNTSGHRESVTLHVRPAPSPIDNERNTAHFFKNEATSSFRVQRNGNVITAEVHGRNEVPNTTVSKTVDKVRNAVVGLGAITAFSIPQWKSLVRGLLDTSITVA
jgi:hypothetical protein